MTGASRRRLMALFCGALVACGAPPSRSEDSTSGRGAPSRAWTSAAGVPLPQPVTNNATAALEIDGHDQIFTFMGLGPGRDYRAITRQAFVLDLSTGEWRALPDVPGEPGRVAATAQAVRGRVYVFGGYSVAEDGAERTSAAVDVFDPRARRYSRGASIPVPVDDTVSGVWRDRLIYLVSGWSADDNVAAVQVYDPEADRWMAGTPIPGTPVFGHAGAIVRDTIVYCGGARVQAPRVPKYAPSAECWRGDIDPMEPTRIDWRPIEAHPGKPRYRAAAGPVRLADVTGVLLVGGTANPYNYDGIGYDGHPSDPEPAAWIYDIDRDRWIEGPVAAVPTMDHRGLVSAGGSWWTIGGFEAGQTVSARVTRYGLQLFR